MKVTEAKNARGQGIFGGCLVGWVAFLVLITGGAVVSFTGIGILVGVPMIIAGLLAPFLGALMGWERLIGDCPWCGSEVRCFATSPGVDCPACKKRIVIKDKRFIGIE